MGMKPILFNTEMVRAILDGRKTQTRRIIKPDAMGLKHENGMPARVPPYEPGDILWVRETWNFRMHGQQGDGFVYRADFCTPDEWPWRPSIHMPKEAARIFLRVTAIRAERLNDITLWDILAEGITFRQKEPICEFHLTNHILGKYAFNLVWDKTILADISRFGWKANPWVWVIQFERIEKKQLAEFADRDTAAYADSGALTPAT